MGVDVDEAGHQPGAVGGDALLRRVGDAADGDDAAVLHAHVGAGRRGAAAVDERCALDQQVQHLFLPREP